MKKYVVLDVETTGLDPQKNALASIGIVVLDENLGQIEEYYAVINEPDKIVEDKALEVNGFTRDELSHGKPVNIVLEEIKPILDGAIMVNHNSAFDVEWLNYRGFNILESIDTMLLSRKKWPSLRAKLGMVCERFSVSSKDAHNSLADSKMTAEILKKFAEFPELDALNPKKIKFNTYSPPRKKYIIISGSRKYFKYEEFDKHIIDILKVIKTEIPDVKRDDVEFVLGDAKGADQLGKRFAEKNGFPYKVFFADWNNLGNSAGMNRNRDMVFYALDKSNDPILIAFPAQDSIGTKGMIDVCLELGVRTYMFWITP